MVKTIHICKAGEIIHADVLALLKSGKSYHK